MNEEEAREAERQEILASVSQLKEMRKGNESIVSALDFLEDVIKQRGK